MNTSRKKLRIKKGATVQVISGSEKGKKGVVMAVDSGSLKVKVQGIRLMTHYDKKDGLIKKEAFFDYSKVKMVEPAAEQKAKTTKKRASASR